VYKSRVVEPILASLEGFQKCESGWTLSRILNLTINVNKYNSLHAGYYRITTGNYDEKSGSQRAIYGQCVFCVISDSALQPIKNHTYRESSYSHYSTILNLTDIVFPMTLNEIKKFENQNNISINVLLRPEDSTISSFHRRLIK